MFTSLRSDAGLLAARSNRYLSRHLAGEFSLSRSLWLHTLIPCLAVPLLGAAALPILGDHFPARYLSLALFALLVLGYLVVAWAVIGTARAAVRHVDRGGSPWVSWLVGLGLFVGLAKLALDTGGAVPLLREHWQVASGAQPGPRPEITLRPDGRSILFAGSLNDGSTDALARALAYFPHVQTVVLKSHGGWIREGEMIARLITRLQLDTSVETYCESSCTVALVAGRKRHAALGARIGFHSGRAIGAGASADDSSGITKRLLAAYRAAGLAPGFIDQVASVPHDSVWYPPHQVLRAVGVLTAGDLTLGELTATQAIRSRSELVDRYRAHESLAVLAERFPGDFDRVVDETWLLLKAGATEEVVQATVRAHLHRLIPAYVRSASDEALTAYLALLRDQLSVLHAQDQQACVELVFPSGHPPAPARFLPTAFEQRERDLLKRVLREADPDRLVAVGDESLAPAVEMATHGLSPLEVAALVHPTIRGEHPAAACAALVKLSGRLVQAPGPARAQVLRLLLDSLPRLATPAAR